MSSTSPSWMAWVRLPTSTPPVLQAAPHLPLLPLLMQVRISAGIAHAQLVSKGYAMRL